MTSQEHPSALGFSLPYDPDALVDELRRLRAALVHSGGPDSGPAGQATALLKLCRDLPSADWGRIATAHDLQEWLALPLEGEIYPQLTRLAQVLEELAHQTRHDPLTGLNNRRVFDQILDLELERARRNHSPLALALLDLDDFKIINDTLGHVVGDQVLMAFASTLRTSKRRYDVAARVGGEEFALVLPGVGILKAQSMLGRVLAAVREIEVPGRPEQGLTCSAGLACTRGRVPVTPEELYRLADGALYEAKAAGKDRFVSAPIPDLAAGPSAPTLVHANEKKFLFTGD